jgi:hypothetical protein
LSDKATKNRVVQTDVVKVRYSKKLAFFDNILLTIVKTITARMIRVKARDT